MANEKHIFIGIGGSGCQTVSQIKSKVYEKRFKEATASKTRLQAMNDSYRFLFIDTDQRDIDEANKRNRESFEQGKVPFISPQTDLINLGRANPQAIYYEAKQDPNTLINKRILEACSPELAVKIPDQPLAFGAGAFRMKSRIAFAHALTDFQNKLQAAISSLNDVKTVGGEDCIIYYWVVGSTLGGTGSGIFNDVLYHVNQIHHQVVGNGDPQLVLTMYMPKVYIDSNSTEEKYTLNAFGVFSELQAFKKMSYEPKQNMVMHRLAFQNDYNLIDSDRRYCPFYYLIPIDIQTDKGTSLGTTRTMYRNTAEMLYHLHHGKAGATFRSDIDNYMNDIMERNHEDFLVPMGYVSLQKPQEQFAKYMRTRLKRDILKSWLLCDNEKQAKVEKSEVENLFKKLFEELDPDVTTSVAHDLLGTNSKLKESIVNEEVQEKMNEEFEFASISMKLGNVETVFQNEKGDEKRNKYKKMLVDGIWKQAEVLIREHGITYTLNSIQEVRKLLVKKYQDEETGDNSIEKRRNALNAQKSELQELSDNAMKVTTMEKITKGNKKQVEEYMQKVAQYVDQFVKLQIDDWSHDLKRDFQNDEKNDELAKLYRHLVSMADKAAEMNRAAVSSYSKLATEFGEASMDVTTVYLPMLKTICDGNGWIVGNFFSNLYGKIIEAIPDKDETPVREKMAKSLVDKSVYLNPDEKTQATIDKGEYIVYLDVKDEEGNDDGVQKKQADVRFFANPLLIEKKVSVEKIIDDFISVVTNIFEMRMHENESIQTLWDNKKISSFFAELTNDEKDEVRRSLNPALFFSYNSNRIDVTKKEEHIVFVAGSEDLATEMLGFQKGNPKHRCEKADDENTALVLKSKFGLSLPDYRIYDSIKMVYDKATFREKYHFHHDFAQYLDKLTIDDLPYEVLPQHRTYAKILLLNKFADSLKPLFYKDEYEPEAYTNVLMFSDCDTSFKIAEPEAFGVNPSNGAIILRKEADGRSLYKEVIGKDFAEQFKQYREMYFNYGFGETTANLIQVILRQNRAIKDDKGNEVNIKGEEILKDGYTAIRSDLLKELSEKRKTAAQPAEKRLYNIFFTIVREELETVHDFIK